MVNMPRPGDLLIAPANMVDPRFRNTVLFLTHHHDEGSFALCINRPTGHTVQEILEGHSIEGEFDWPLYWGGPVNPGTVWMLHDTGWRNPHTIKINDDWSMTSHVSMFNQIREDLPKRFRIFFGYASWAPEQLAKEFLGVSPWRRDHSWLTATNPDPDWLMDLDETELWSNSVELSAHQAVEQWL